MHEIPWPWRSSCYCYQAKVQKCAELKREVCKLHGVLKNFFCQRQQTMASYAATPNVAVCLYREQQLGLDLTCIGSANVQGFSALQYIMYGTPSRINYERFCVGIHGYSDWLRRSRDPGVDVVATTRRRADYLLQPDSRPVASRLQV